MRKKVFLALFFFSFLLFGQNGYIKIPVLTDVTSLIANSGRPITFAGRFDVDSRGYFYIQDMDTGNIAKFSPSGAYIKDLLQIGTGKKEISSLHDFLIKGQNLYVLDNNFSGVKVFDLDGNFLFSFKTEDPPYSIAVSNTGEIYVPDFSNKVKNIISVYSPRGKFLRSFGDPFYDARFSDKKKNRILNRTLIIRISRNDEVYILSLVLPSFRKYSPTRLLVYDNRIKGPEVPKGDIVFYDDTLSLVNAAVDMALDSEGRIIISFPSTCAYVYNPEGALIKKIAIDLGGNYSSPQKFILLSGKIYSVIPEKILILDYNSIKGQL